MMKASKQISIDTVGKRALKLVKLPSKKVIRPKPKKILLSKVAKFFRRLQDCYVLT